MAKSLTFSQYGTPGNVPNNATIEWLPSLTSDIVLVELYDGLTIGELEVLTNTPQIDTFLTELKIPGYNNKYIKLQMVNTQPSKAIAARSFNITIRHIDTAVIFGVLTVNYETTYDGPGLVNSVTRQWTTNANYGNGTTTVRPDGILKFTRLNQTYNTIEDVLIIKDKSKQGYKPQSWFDISRKNILTYSHGNPPAIATEGPNLVSKYNPVLRTLSDGITGINKVPVFLDLSNSKAGGNEILFAIVNALDIRTSNTAARNNLPWGSTFTIIIDKKYPAFTKQCGIHPNLPQSVEDLSVTWDDQQSDIVKIYPYVHNDQFQCKIQPLKNVTRAAIVGMQMHNSCAWDNGFYANKTVRFDLVPGTNTTPIDLLEKVITVKVGETKDYMVFTPSGQYRFVIDKPNICSINQNQSKVVGLAPGTAYVTFYSTYSSFAEGSIKLQVNVVAIPDTPSLKINRKIVIVAVGDSAGVNLTAIRADNLRFEQNPDGYVRVYNYTNYNDSRTEVSGKVNFRGLKVGITQVKIISTYKGVDQVSDIVEIHVIERGTYKIFVDPKKVRIDIKKNAEKHLPLWATTNCKYIKYSIPEQNSFGVNGDPVFTELNCKIFPKTERGKYIMTLYGHNLDPNQRLVTLEVPVIVTKNVEVPKDQIWVSLEHKQPGYNDNEDLDNRYFTVLKWLNRKNISDVNSHIIKLPNKSGRLLTQKQLDEAIKFPKRYYEYASESNPTRKVNPSKIDSLWLNTTDGKLWRCIDITKNDNAWLCEDGRQIGNVEKLIYPEPGEKGFGVGPMSIDVSEKLGLIPLDGCYDMNSDNYGNYKDKNGNILVSIPKHYVKLDGNINKE